MEHMVVQIESDLTVHSCLKKKKKTRQNEEGQVDSTINRGPPADFTAQFSFIL